ncbi:hypothetical protein CTI14_46290, partial [Methylobacterium radiotolerans]
AARIEALLKVLHRRRTELAAQIANLQSVQPSAAGSDERKGRPPERPSPAPVSLRNASRPKPFVPRQSKVAMTGTIIHRAPRRMGPPAAHGRTRSPRIWSRLGSRRS